MASTKNGSGTEAGEGRTCSKLTHTNDQGMAMDAQSMRMAQEQMSRMTPEEVRGGRRKDGSVGTSSGSVGEGN